MKDVKNIGLGGNEAEIGWSLPIFRPDSRKFGRGTRKYQNATEGWSMNTEGGDDKGPKKIGLDENETNDDLQY